MKTLLVAVAVLAALAAGVVHAGPLAPTPRVVGTLERDAIERSGAQTLEEYLDTGIARYFFTGGQALLVLVNGRPYASTSSDLDTLPLSAIERIELLSGDSLGTMGGSAVRGALNVVLREDLDGFETRALARLPSADGGDGWQGSVFWGGEVGKGRMTLGVDVLRREEIRAQSRDYSRSVWREGGSFSETANVSPGGNTVWVVQRDDDGNPTGVRSVALGDCDLARGYTGPLIDPPGIRSGEDTGCGFAYSTIMWNSDHYEQKSAVLNLDHPLTETADFHVDANFTRADTAFRYAPSVGWFGFDPNEALLAAINEAAGSAFEADGNDRFVVAHRFVRHGNRDWLTDSEEYDVSMGIEGRITESLGYDVRIAAFRLDAFVGGDTFVHEATIAAAIKEGHYKLADPFSDAPEHERAIEESSLRLENDFASDYLGARLALEGSGFAIGSRNVAWTAGFELDRVDAHDVTVYRGKDGTEYNIHEVLGTGGASYEGERKAWGGFAEMSLPLAERLDLRVGGRMDDYDDVGGVASWRLGAEYRLTDIFTLRGSWSAGERAPSLFNLHAFDLQDHPYIECDPGTGPSPRTCTPNPRQVTRETAGNPDLDPSSTERIAVGAGARKGPLFLNVEAYRLSRSDRPGQNSADWAMQNLDECMGADQTDCIHRDGGDITIRDSYANVVDDGVSGINIRTGTGFRTGWGVVGLRGAWRHVADADLEIAGEKDRLAIPKNAARFTVLARRGNVTATWTTYYRSSYKNRTGSGTFDSWIGHDLTLDWNDPLGLKGARVTGGVFNVTDAGLSINTANPQSVDGPTEAGWGRTFFLALRMQF